MPKINVAKPFNYQKGGKVQHVAKGEQTVDDDVAEHAEKRGYLVAPKAKAGAAEPEAQPAGDNK